MDIAGFALPYVNTQKKIAVSIIYNQNQLAPYLRYLSLAVYNYLI